MMTLQLLDEEINSPLGDTVEAMNAAVASMADNQVDDEIMERVCPACEAYASEGVSAKCPSCRKNTFKSADTCLKCDYNSRGNRQ